MRHIDILTFYLVLKVSSVDATNDNDHPFIRRVQTNQLPQCGNPNLCWCDMNASTPPATECPPYPANSIYTSKLDEANFFDSLELMNPRYKDLQLCYPDLSTSKNLEGKSVDPNILCDEEILVGGKAAKKTKTTSECLPPCKSHPETAVCGIKFMRGNCKITPDEFDTDCLSENVADSYIIRTFYNDAKREKSGYFPFHEGGESLISNY